MTQPARAANGGTHDSDTSVGHPADLQRLGECDVQIDQRSTVHVNGELDCATAPTLAAALKPLTAHGGAVSIDLAGVEFIDGAGINVLCAAAQALGTRGRIVVRDPSPRTRRLIEITAVDQLFDVDVGA